MAKFIMAGPLQAIGFILLFTGLSFVLPLMSLLSGAAIGLVTLRLGWQRGLTIAAASSAVLGALSLLWQDELLQNFALNVLLWLPLILAASFLSYSVSWSRTLMAIWAIFSLGLGIFHLSVTDPAAFWQQQAIWNQFVELVKNMQLLPDLLTEAEKQELLSTVAQLMTGTLAMTAVLMLILSLLIARLWQSMLYNPGGFQQEWRQLNLGRIPAVVMIAMTVIALLTGQPWSIDIVLVGLAIFLFQGLAMIHGILAAKQWHKRWLIGLYVLLAILPMQIGILIAAFGIIDGLADFRSLSRANHH